MAGADRMTIEEIVKRVLLEEHADVLRVAVETVCAELMRSNLRSRSAPSAVGADRMIG